MEGNNILVSLRPGRRIHGALVLLIQVLAIVVALPQVAGHSLSSDLSVCAYTTSNYLTYPECSWALVSTGIEATSTILTASTTVARTTITVTTTYKSLSVAPAPSGDDAEATSFSATGSTQLPAEATKPESTVKPDDTETDSYLDPSSFLSFDEWKSQNFKNAGLSSEDINKRRQDVASAARRSSPEQPLDTIGDDMEVDLALFGQSPDSVDDGAASIMAAEAETSPKMSEETRGRLKDAGKTSRERSNYASTACAASILKTNPEMRGASAILFENKDTYMLNPSSASNKFVIIELCEDIQIDTIVLANYEFFSSMVRKFRVSVSIRYPVKASGWTVLGEFEARNVREIQPFLVRNSLIWARFLKIEFLSHWGHEFYCPLSLIRVHGTTMMEEYWYQEKLIRGEDDEREDVVAEAVASEVYVEQMKAKEDDPVIVETPSFEASKVSSGQDMEIARIDSTTSPSIDLGFVTMELKFCPSESDLYIRKYLLQISDPVVDTPFSAFGYYYGDGNLEPKPMKPVVVPARIMTSNSSSREDSKETVSPTELGRSTGVTQTSTERTVRTVQNAQESANFTSPELVATEGQNIEPESTPHAVSSPPSISTTSTTAISSTSPSSTLSSMPNNPTTQESVYKTIMKRLTLLEANATLSLQYIEEQSRMLRDAFSKVERRQNLRITDMLDGLNATVNSQLHVFKQQYELQREHYEQLWQQTVMELETQRKKTERHLIEIIILLFCVCMICVAFDVYIIMKMKIKVL
ncbi:UNC-like C-terminal-domain-containing protein [Lipomyces kononenkoae]|uniref:UNC-like C-terminal-domain-containing protein n=1 Tax=Lipomyces kononenkoae TaxID=34357 RepID=A0ACC3TC93_LIPKO